MRSSIFLLATALAYVSAQGASGAPEPTVTAAPGTLELGAECATTEQCAGGAECWASNAMLIRRCGNFNASCKSDAHCAFNSCNNGLCNGFVSTTTTAAPTDAPGPSGAPEPTVTAAPGTLALGAECATTEQCAGGAQCWASNAMLIRRCGNFNAECKSDAHCAFNSCNNGLCNGFLTTTTAAPTDAPGPSGAPEPTVTAAPGTLELGAECATTEQCAGGAQCWASNAMLIRRCGNFNAECKSDAQCAFNICNNGLCNGLKPSGSETAAPTTTGGNTPPIPTVTAPAGSLPLGATCSSSEQCANGAQCYATNSMLIPACGNFQASCTSDAQCAFNTCNQGFCNGLKPSTSLTTAAPTYGGNGTATVPPTLVPTYTGAANKKNVGVVGLVGAVVAAFVL
ncbi:hypothetical protein TWF730_006644 [Orbilia blumenaviensis]|uniref:Uncharacterized protein n=1 Tax=Orbilia blumenaviensis TaxID=1796055 RepID=A0AAV9VF94_9PEZI